MLSDIAIAGISVIVAFIIVAVAFGCYHFFTNVELPVMYTIRN